MTAAPVTRPYAGGTARSRWSTVVASLALALFALGARPIIDYRDLTCSAGYGARPVSVAYWAVQCQANDEHVTWPRSVPIARDVGLFLANVDVRVFHVHPSHTLPRVRRTMPHPLVGGKVDDLPARVRTRLAPTQVATRRTRC